MKIFVRDGVLSDLYVVNALPWTESTVGSWLGYHIKSSFLKSNSQLLLIEVFCGKIHHRIFGWQSSRVADSSAKLCTNFVLKKYVGLRLYYAYYIK